MNTVLLMLCAFVGVGVLCGRSRSFTFAAVGLIVLAGVFYAYIHA